MVCVKMILPVINHGCSVNLNLKYGCLVLVSVSLLLLETILSQTVTIDITGEASDGICNTTHWDGTNR